MNLRYGRNYYTRAYKRFVRSTETIVELIDKTTGNVLETRTVNASSGVPKIHYYYSSINGLVGWNTTREGGPGNNNIQLRYEVGYIKLL